MFVPWWLVMVGDRQSSGLWGGRPNLSCLSPSPGHPAPECQDRGNNNINHTRSNQRPELVMSLMTPELLVTILSWVDMSDYTKLSRQQTCIVWLVTLFHSKHSESEVRQTPYKDAVCPDDQCTFGLTVSQQRPSVFKGAHGHQTTLRRLSS